MDAYRLVAPLDVQSRSVRFAVGRQFARTAAMGIRARVRLYWWMTCTQEKHMQHTDTHAITHMCIVVNIDRLCWGLWPTTRAVLPRTPDHRTGVPFDWEQEDPEFYRGNTQDSQTHHPG